MAQQATVIQNGNQGRWGRTCVGSFFLSLCLGPIFGLCTFFCSSTPLAQFGTLVGSASGTFIISLIILTTVRSVVSETCNSYAYCGRISSSFSYNTCMRTCTMNDTFGIMGGLLLGIAILMFLKAWSMYPRIRQTPQINSQKLNNVTHNTNPFVHNAPLPNSKIYEQPIPMRPTPSRNSHLTSYAVVASGPSPKVPSTSGGTSIIIGSHYGGGALPSHLQNELAAFDDPFASLKVDSDVVKAVPAPNLYPPLPAVPDLYTPPPPASNPYPTAPPLYNNDSVPEASPVRKVESLSTLAARLDIPCLLDLAEMGVTSEQLARASVMDAQHKYGLSKPEFLKLKKYFIGV